jgi:hypothetical protein
MNGRCMGLRPVADFGVIGVDSSFLAIWNHVYHMQSFSVNCVRFTATS